MTAPRVAPLLAGHRSRVEEILRATGAFRDEEVAVALELVDDATGSAPSGDYSCLGAFDDRDALTGYACFGATPGTDGTFDLYWIATDPARHGGGHGRALLGAVEHTLAARRGRLLVAETSSRDDYAGTRRFYAACGYDAAATIADFYAPGDSRVMYVKRLDGAHQERHQERHEHDRGHSFARVAVAESTAPIGSTDGGTSPHPTGAPDGRGAAAR